MMIDAGNEVGGRGEGRDGTAIAINNTPPSICYPAMNGRCVNYATQALKSSGGFVWACKNYDGDVQR